MSLFVWLPFPFFLSKSRRRRRRPLAILAALSRRPSKSPSAILCILFPFFLRRLPCLRVCLHSHVGHLTCPLEDDEWRCTIAREAKTVWTFESSRNRKERQTEAAIERIRCPFRTLLRREPKSQAQERGFHATNCRGRECEYSLRIESCSHAQAGCVVHQLRRQASSGSSSSDRRSGGCSSRIRRSEREQLSSQEQVCLPHSLTLPLRLSSCVSSRARVRAAMLAKLCWPDERRTRKRDVEIVRSSSSSSGSSRRSE